MTTEVRVATAMRGGGARIEQDGAGNWLDRLTRWWASTRPHEFGGVQEWEVWNGGHRVSARRVRVCQRCGATDVQASCGTRCCR